MSFTKKYLDQIEKIILDIENRPELVYLAHSKVDAFFGNTNSLNLIDEFIKTYEEDPKQDFRAITGKYK
jgi:tyrosyl-tRNA synthetase